MLGIIATISVLIVLVLYVGLWFWDHRQEHNNDHWGDQ